MYRDRRALYLGLGWLVAGFLCAGGDPKGAEAGTPTVGGPYNSLLTHWCSTLGNSYCYSATSAPPLSTAGDVLPYMDNAARNWGCDWNLGLNAVHLTDRNNAYKWYGSLADPAQGCGIVWWNYARQAAYFMPSADAGGNVAASSQGAVAYASSTLSPNHPVSAVNDGNSKGNVWGSGGGWSGNAVPTAGAPQWVQINLPGPRTINRIEVTTLQDNYSNPVEPTLATTFSSVGIVSFSVRYWNGSSWVTVASVTNNNRVVRRFTFAPVSASAIRVTITGVVGNNNARIVEIRGFETSSTSSKLYAKYCALGCSESGPLGLPISNPTPYGSAGATYQQFTNGIITHIYGNGTAFAVGGTRAEDRALAAKYASHFSVNPDSGPAVYGLAYDPTCTDVTGAECGSAHAGRHVGWWNSEGHFNELMIAKTGWTKAVLVAGPILAKWAQDYGASAPWNGPLGFPITDLLPTGSPTQHQEFEQGTILWELDGCSTGRYSARIVSQFRRPLSEGNLTMLCEPSPPPNNRLSTETGSIAFDAGGRTGSYTFHSSREAAGWFKGVAIRFDGGAPLEVNGAIYDAWIGGAGGRGNVTDALNMAAPASDWGEPTSNAECADNPCSMMLQRFSRGVATLNTGGIVGWAPDSAMNPGLIVPVGLGSIDWGYATPTETGDPRLLAGLPRSGDYVRLTWLNKSTASGVTTTLHRAVTPLNGSQGPYTPIQPHYNLAAGTITEYTDSGATNNARNCYYLSVSDGSSTSNTSPYCIFTLDGTTDPHGNDHSVIRRVGRARIVIDVPTSPSDSGTRKRVAVRLNSNGQGFDYNRTYVDSIASDFELGSTNVFDLGLAGASNNAPIDLDEEVVPIDIQDVADIAGLTIESYADQYGNDNLRISRVALMLDNVTVFEKSFATPFLVSNSAVPGGTRLTIGFDELRSNPLWNDIYDASGTDFIGLTAGEFTKKLDGVLGNVVARTPGADHHGSRLKDGAATSLTRLDDDRVRVVQRIIASQVEGVDCTVSYDLHIVARDIEGHVVHPPMNPPAPGSTLGTIFTTEVRLVNAHPHCSVALWKAILNEVVALIGFGDRIGNLERDLQRSLEAIAPSRITSSPPLLLHFCFPGNGIFANGGFSLCAG